MHIINFKAAFFKMWYRNLKAWLKPSLGWQGQNYFHSKYLDAICLFHSLSLTNSQCSFPEVTWYTKSQQTEYKSTYENPPTKIEI